MARIRRKKGYGGSSDEFANRYVRSGKMSLGARKGRVRKKPGKKSAYGGRYRRGGKK